MHREDRKKQGIRNLPGTLNEAVEELREDPVLIEALGEHVFTQYTQGKIREWEQYRSRVSNWELERYMIRY